MFWTVTRGKDLVNDIQYELFLYKNIGADYFDKYFYFKDVSGYTFTAVL